MALFEDLFKGGNLVTGLAIGIGAGVLAPVVGPALRPIAKAIIKAGLIAYDQSRAALAELGEQAGDIVAEAQAEMTHFGESSDAEPIEHGAGGKPRRRTARSTA